MSAPERPMRKPKPGADAHRSAARTEFFQAVDEVAPHLGRTLADTVGPSFLALVEELEATGSDARTYPESGMLEKLSERRTRAESAHPSPARTRILGRIEKEEAFMERWNAWARTPNLHRDAWILAHVWRVLWRHRDRLDSINGLGSPGPGWAYSVPASGLEPPEYRPDLMARADFLAKAEEYVDAVEEAFRAAGWEPSPYLPSGRAHLKWLARHQCLRLPYDKCGKADVSNIRKEIAKFAALLPLTLRPARGRKSPK